jgi:hypothetical protein
LTAAFEIIFQYGIYDITPEDYATQHTKDFCATDATFKTMQEAFNNTVIANENRIHNIYNNYPLQQVLDVQKNLANSAKA